MLTIAIDKDIPHADDLLGDLGRLESFDGRSLTPGDLAHVDILVVRTVTPVTRRLLTGSSVRMVGSAASGTDHIDFETLSDLGISFTSALGSNASTVGDYVVTSILALACRENKRIDSITVGIVGCGQVGGRLANRLPHLGLKVVVNDPPLQELARKEGRDTDFVTLDDLLCTSDIVTLHVPLERSGDHPTYGLIQNRQLQLLRPDTWLFNTSRGGVVSENHLKERHGQRPPGQFVIDVWEREPHIDLDLLAMASLATPHVAGYSREAKQRAVLQIREGILAFLGQEGRPSPAASLCDRIQLDAPETSLPTEAFLYALARQAFDVEQAHASTVAVLTETALIGPTFTELRQGFLKRRGFEVFEVSESRVPAELIDAVTHGLGFGLT